MALVLTECSTCMLVWAQGLLHWVHYWAAYDHAESLICLELEPCHIDHRWITHMAVKVSHSWVRTIHTAHDINIQYVHEAIAVLRRLTIRDGNNSENDARLRTCANCSSLGASSTTVTIRLDWQESCHDLRQELGSTTVWLDWHLSAIK